jgi:hypothetical protein
MGLEFWDIFAHVDRLPLLFSHYSCYPFLFFLIPPSAFCALALRFTQFR